MDWGAGSIHGIIGAWAVVIAIAIASGVVGVPLAVDAVDTQPDSVLYPLERLGESIRGFFVGGQAWEIELCLERTSELVYITNIGGADEYPWLLDEADAHLFSAAKMTRDGPQFQAVLNATKERQHVFEGIKPEFRTVAVGTSELQTRAISLVMGAQIENFQVSEPLSQIEALIENRRLENSRFVDAVVEDELEGTLLSHERPTSPYAETEDGEIWYYATVLIAADEEFRNFFGGWWDDIALRSLEYADDKFVEKFKLDFVVVGFVPYESDDSLKDLDLFRDARRKVDKGDANIVIYVCGQGSWEYGGLAGRDEVIVFWFPDSLVVRHELSHLFNAPDHGYDPFRYCLMSYVWGTWLAEDWCGECEKTIGECVVEHAPIEVWTNKVVYGVDEEVKFHLRNESHMSLVVGDWWIEKREDGEWKPIYPSLQIIRKETIEPGAVERLTWDQKVGDVFTREDRILIVEGQAEPGWYRAVWEARDSETGETFGRCKSAKFAITGTILQVEPAGAILKMGENQSFAAKIVTLYKTDGLWLSSTEWVTDKATWIVSDSNVGDISNSLFSAKAAGDVIVTASYQGYPDDARVIVLPELIIFHLETDITNTE